MDKLNCQPLTPSQYFQKHNVSFQLLKSSFMPLSKVFSYRSFMSIIKIISGIYIYIIIYDILYMPHIYTIIFCFIVNPCWSIASPLTHTAVYMSGGATVMKVVKLDQNSPRQREKEGWGEKKEKGEEDEDRDKERFTSPVSLASQATTPPMRTQLEAGEVESAELQIASDTWAMEVKDLRQTQGAACDNFKIPDTPLKIMPMPNASAVAPTISTRMWAIREYANRCRTEWPKQAYHLQWETCLGGGGWYSWFFFFL